MPETMVTIAPTEGGLLHRSGSSPAQNAEIDSLLNQSGLDCSVKKDGDSRPQSRTRMQRSPSQVALATEVLARALMTLSNDVHVNVRWSTLR
eukprot:jgi/Botrbrau1/2193/Bobra.101_2s0024.1